MWAWRGTGGLTNDRFGVDSRRPLSRAQRAAGSHTFSRRGGRPSFAAHCARARCAPTAPPQRMQPVGQDWPGLDRRRDRSVTAPHSGDRRPGLRPPRSRRPRCSTSSPTVAWRSWPARSTPRSCSDRPAPGARRVLPGLAGRTLGRRSGARRSDRELAIRGHPIMVAWTAARTEELGAAIYPRRLRYD